MSVLSTDITYTYTGSGTSDNPELSLGGSATSNIVGTTLEKLFDVVAPDEAAAGSIKYRAIDVNNENDEDTFFDAYLWVSLETVSSDTTVAVGYDSVGTQTIANETTAPSGVTFSTPLSKAAGISLGDMAPGERRRIWLRRTVTAGAAKISDSGAIIVGGGTL